MKDNLNSRKYLPHNVPDWVALDSVYFITICTKPRGLNQLCKNPIAQKIRKSIFYYQKGNKWWIHYFLLMPDHLHCLLSFAYSPDLKHTINNWKRYIAKECNIKWQRDFFDHRLRREELITEKENYISMNPIRAGLVKNVEMWNYSWRGIDIIED